MNMCPPLNSYIEILAPSVMVLGCGVFGRCLGHDGSALMNEIRALKRRNWRVLSLFFLISVSCPLPLSVCLSVSLLSAL